MVRFSDMLGGSGEPDDAAAAESPYAALADEARDSDADALDADAEDEAETVKEPVPMATFESPEAVLDRLTQYATSARATEPVAAEPVEPEPAETEPVAAEPAEPEAVEPEAEVVEPEPAEPDGDQPLPPVGDDFLPTSKGIARRGGRGRKRHP